MNFVLLFILSLISFIFSLLIFFFKKIFMIEWIFMSINSVNFEMMILLDWVSMLFISLVLLISSMVMLYSKSYMMNDKSILRFNSLILMFVMSMILMILSPNLMSILLGWDGLGLVSYCLVIYYQNSSSYNSGMVTVLSNRIGDIMLMMSIGVLSSNGSWNLILNKNFIMINMVMLMLMIAAFTKSAQVPFSSWLPMAMAAPTPVSSLVHSSTLVTAGVYMMIRYNDFMKSYYFCYLMLWLSLITMFMAGIMANYENDLKKIIALSTLSQLGLMMMVLSVGMKMLAFFHLFTHALFKSLLFLTSGIMIHFFNNNQDIRYMGGMLANFPYMNFSFICASMALCGFPFLSGFYSKDLIIEIFLLMKMNFIMIIMMMLSIGFTISYSVRLMKYLLFYLPSNLAMNYFEEDNYMNFSMIILSIFSILMGTVMSWMVFYAHDMIILSKFMKLLTLLFMIIFIFIGGMDLIFLYFKSLDFFMKKMWMLNMSYSFMNMYVYSVISETNKLEKMWSEFYFGSMSMKYYYKFNKNFIYFLTNIFKLFLLIILLLMFVYM